MNELTKYITDTLKNLALKVLVNRSADMLKITIAKPFVQEISVFSIGGTHYWNIMFDTSPEVLVCTDGMIEEILDKQSTYRSWGKGTDKGLLVVIRENQICEKPMFNGRFSIGTEIRGTMYIHHQPFIDHWKYILIGLNKYGLG